MSLAVAALLLLALLQGKAADQDPLAQAEAAVAAAPQDRDALLRLAFLRYHRDELDQAAELFRRSQALHGPDWYPTYMLGCIAERRFDHATALERYREAAVLAPAAPAPAEAILRLEALERDLERFRAARRRLDRDGWIVAAAGGLLLIVAVAVAARP